MRYVAQAISAKAIKFVKILRQISVNHSVRLNTRFSFVSAKDSCNEINLSCYTCCICDRQQSPKQRGTKIFKFYCLCIKFLKYCSEYEIHLSYGFGVAI